MMKENRFKRIIALALCVLLGCAVAGAEEDGRVVDPSTMNTDQIYFTEESTKYAGLVWTDKSVFKNADDFDGVEVDCDTHNNHKALEMLDEDKNFLVALSSSASNKEIKGYSLKPTDTVFVLDMSSSMWQNDKTNKANQRIQKLIPAANKAIDELLKVNQNNRIGVVLYSGLQTNTVGSSAENTTQILLPLDRYTTGTDGEYLTLSDGVKDSKNDWEYYVSVDQDVKNSNDNDVTGEKLVNGATYLQNGLYHAWKAFEDVNCLVGEENPIQEGTRRIPAIIVLSDGAPTAVTTNYAPTGNIGASDYGNGRLAQHTDGLAFLTQLTASWLYKKVDEKYNTGATNDDRVIPLFYTLGIGLSESGTGEGEQRAAIAARYVMDPAYQPKATSGVDYEVYNALNSFWSALKNNSSTSISMELVRPDGTNTKEVVTVAKTETDLNQNYVNKYYDVDDDDNLTDAFQSIVQEIELQSRYHATVTNPDDGGFYSGYVTFIDDIGEHMEVKDVKGLIIDGKLYSGEHIEKMFNTTSLGDWQNQHTGTNDGYLLIDALATRLGLDKTIGSADRGALVDLVGKAYTANQLGEHAEEVGNSFGWYADVNGDIIKTITGEGTSQQTTLAFWDWNGTATPPNGAAYKVRSYIFYDDLSGGNAERKEHNTLFISVQVRENITTGLKSLVWRIPSRLLPMNEYEVALYNENNNGELNTGELAVDVNMEAAQPIRLVYEIGAEDGFESHEIEETIARRGISVNKIDNIQNATSDHDHNHQTHEEQIIRDAEGAYYLYSNAFDKALEGDGFDDDNHVSSQINTVSYFKPSIDNERYRHTTDTDIYQKNGDTYTQYTGSAAPSGEGYYFMRYLYEKDANGVYQVNEVPSRIDPHTLALHSGQNDHNHIQQKDGQWVILTGTIEYPQEEERVHTDSTNPTSTIRYAHYPIVEQSETAHPVEEIEKYDFIVSSVLGNNGRLRIMPDTGIAIRKQMMDGAATDATYTFIVTRTDDMAKNGTTYKLVHQSADGTETIKENQQFIDGVAVIQIKPGETARLLGLPIGSTYTVTEELDNGFGYKLENVVVTDVRGNVIMEDAAMDVKMIAGSQMYVTFTNSLPGNEKGYARLALRKEVSHNYGGDFVIPQDAEFVFQLDFTKMGASSANINVNLMDIYANDVIYDTEGNAYPLDSKGVAHVTMNPDQEIVFTGIEVGTNVVIKEIIEPQAGYEIKEIRGKNLKIGEDQTAVLVVDDEEEISVVVNNMYLKPNLPSTGDNSRLMMWATLLAMCGAAAMITARKRRGEN